MEALGSVVNSVVPVLLIIALGWVCARVLKFDFGPLVDWVIFIAQPALLVSVLSHHPVAAADLAMTSLGTLFVVATVGLAAGAAGHLLGERRGEFHLCAIFANTANIPLPLALLAFGPEALAFQTVYFAANALLLFTLGVALVAPAGNGCRQLLKLPLLYGVLIGLALSLTGTRLPELLDRPVTMVGDTAIPLLLFTLGLKLGRPGAAGARPVGAIVLLRTLGGTLAGLLFVLLFAPEPAVARAVVLGAAMPCAVQTFMVSARFGREPERAARAVVVSTALALFYVPLLIWFLATW